MVKNRTKEISLSKEGKRKNLIPKLRHPRTASNSLAVNNLFAEHNTQDWWGKNSTKSLPWLYEVLSTFDGEYEGLCFNFTSEDSDADNNSEKINNSNQATNTDKVNPVFTLITSDIDINDNNNQEKIKSRIEKKEKLIKSMPPNYRFNIIHRSGLWEHCQKNDYDLIKIIASGIHINDKGILVRISTMWLHCQKVIEKFEKYVVAYVLAGSWIRGDATSKSDVDFYIVIDDTDVNMMSRTELKGRLRDIVNSRMSEICNNYKTDIPFNCQTYILTDFWEGIRAVNPVYYTFLRDGVAFFDKGMFSAWQQLLKMGRLQPSPVSAQLCREQSELAFKEAQKHLREIVMDDLYYTALLMTQSALMALGIAPPSPKECSRIAKKHLIEYQKLIAEPTFFQILERLIVIRKELEHGTIKLPDVNGLGTLMALTEEYTRKLNDIFPQIEKIGEIQSIVKITGVSDNDAHNPDFWLKKLKILLSQNITKTNTSSMELLVSTLRDVAKYHRKLRKKDIVGNELNKFNNSLKTFRQAIADYRHRLIALSSGS